MKSSSANVFSSEGFDLDAVASDTSAENVVLELGGGFSRLTTTTDHHEENNHDHQKQSQSESLKSQESTTSQESQSTPPEPSPLADAELWKQRGNDAFTAGRYTDAYEAYTQAIQATPSPVTTAELLEQRTAWEEEQHKLARQRLMERDARERAKASSSSSAAASSSSAMPPPAEQQQQPAEKEEEEPVALSFQAPPNEYAKELAIYHANRAAASLHLKQPSEAVTDCDVAILWNPTYLKAWIRRATAHEQVDQTDLALSDAKRAMELAREQKADKKTVQTLTQTIQRLEKIEHERLEKLKEETLGKLKDLGNSILSNFGLSLDNFKAVQDPKTGSYSISLEQNK